MSISESNITQRSFFLSMCNEKYFWHLRHRIWYCFDNYFTYFVPVFKYCYSDSRNLWTVMRSGGLAPLNLIQPTISLEMPVPSQGHYGFHSFPVVDWFCLIYNYEFWLSLCKIVRSSVILLLPLYISMFHYIIIHLQHRSACRVLFGHCDPSWFRLHRPMSTSVPLHVICIGFVERPIFWKSKLVSRVGSEL